MTHPPRRLGAARALLAHLRQVVLQLLAQHRLGREALAQVGAVRLELLRRSVARAGGLDVGLGGARGAGQGWGGGA